LEVTLIKDDVHAESLAQFAIDSVRKNKTRNAIRYLAQNIEHGTITPLTYVYRDAILRRAEAADLKDAEQVVLRSSHSSRKDR
jgi:hypothetical protein